MACCLLPLSQLFGQKQGFNRSFFRWANLIQEGHLFTLGDDQARGRVGEDVFAPGVAHRPARPCPEIARGDPFEGTERTRHFEREAWPDAGEDPTRAQEAGAGLVVVRDERHHLAAELHHQRMIPVARAHLSGRKHPPCNVANGREDGAEIVRHAPTILRFAIPDGTEWYHPSMRRLALVAVLAVACTPSKSADDPSTPAATVSVGQVAPRPPQPTIPAAPVDRDPPVPVGALPLGTYTLGKNLGEPCDEKSAAHCGTKGRLAFVVKRVEHFYGQQLQGGKPELPCKYEPTTAPNDFRDPEGRSVCEAEGRVYVHTVCRMCRINSATDAVGVLDEMTDTQLRYAQKMAGLPSDPLLRTGNAWRGAVASRPLPAKN